MSETYYQEKVDYWKNKAAGYAANTWHHMDALRQAAWWQMQGRIAQARQREGL